MPPALFRDPYLLSFATEDLEQYCITRGCDCDEGLSRAELVDLILKSLSLEGRRPDWAVHTRRAGRMNLREKPKDSGIGREKDSKQTNTGGKVGKDSPSRYSEGMRPDLEIGATPVDAVVASAMQDLRRL